MWRFNPDALVPLALWTTAAIFGMLIAYLVRAWWTGPIVAELRGLRRDLKDRKP